jgi:hypothetical protein
MIPKPDQKKGQISRSLAPQVLFGRMIGHPLRRSEEMEHNGGIEKLEIGRFLKLIKTS